MLFYKTTVYMAVLSLMSLEDLQVEHQVCEPISKRNLSTNFIGQKVVAAWISNQPDLL